LEVSTPEQRKNPLTHAGAKHTDDEEYKKNRGNPQFDEPRIKPTKSGE